MNETYSANEVEWLLMRYAALKSSAYPLSSLPRIDTYQVIKTSGSGDHASDTLSYSAGQSNQYQRLSRKEELACSLLDLEAALPILSDRERAIVYEYLVIGTDSAKELAYRLGFSSASSIRNNITRICQRLAERMNGAY
jgi:hypothetical protein